MKFTLKIQNPKVRDNVVLFKSLVERQVTAKKPAEQGPAEQGTYDVYVNRATGDFVFGELPAAAPKREWKAVHLRLRADIKEENKGLFEVEETGAEAECFHCDDLTAAAYRVMAKTLETLNWFCCHTPHPSNPAEVLEEFAGAEITAPKKSFERPLLMQRAWQKVDRFGAEELLSGQNAGTYLFRKDPFAAVLEKELCHHFAAPIKCATLTFIDAAGKVSDLTLVQTAQGWQIYDDDPNLKGENYSSLEALLQGYPELGDPYSPDAPQS